MAGDGLFLVILVPVKISIKISHSKDHCIRLCKLPLSLGPLPGQLRNLLGELWKGSAGEGDEVGARLPSPEKAHDPTERVPDGVPVISVLDAPRPWWRLLGQLLRPLRQGEKIGGLVGLNHRNNPNKSDTIWLLCRLAAAPTRKVDHRQDTSSARLVCRA